jgi:Zn-dependent membrane protease YugP
VLGGVGFLFYVYSVVLSALTLKTERKAQEKAYQILKENDFVTEEELSCLKELFHLYNVQYINDIILASLELLYVVIEILSIIQDGSSIKSK